MLETHHLSVTRLFQKWYLLSVSNIHHTYGTLNF